MTDAGAPAPEVYRLSMEKLPAAVGRARRLALVEVLLGVTAVVALVEALLRHSSSATDVSLVVWGLGVLLAPYVLWKAGLRVRRRWNAFELSIGPTNMRCAARGSGRVTMALDEIESIDEGASGLVVRSSSGSVIRIPRFVEGFRDVRARLERRRPLAPRADARAWCAGLAATCASGVEVRWHPRLPPAKKLAGVAFLAFAAALPVLGLVGREFVIAAGP
jgi:hypothetical protein